MSLNGQRQMRINQACLRRLGVVFRLQLSRPGVLYVNSKNAPLSRWPLFQVAIFVCGVSQLYALTAVTSGRSG